MITDSRDITINVLPLGKAAQQGAFELFLRRWHDLCKVRRWNGLKVNLDLSSSPATVSVGGGRFRLQKRIIHIVSETPNNDELSSDALLVEWMAKYALFFIVCDAEELLMSADIRHEMAFYRMGMRLGGRYFDCFLLLTNCEEILDIEYTGDYPTTMLGICTAFSRKGYNNTRLVSKYQQLWNELASEYIGQVWGIIKTKIKGCQFLLPANLLCTSRLYIEAGYLEALRFSINRLYAEHHLSINRITNNKLYNDIQTIMNWNFFNRRPNGKEIRLAVVGQTSSGKTYLLIDLCQAIAQMGYQEHNDARSPFRYVGQFVNKMVRPGFGVIGTPQYVCRQENHYKTNYKSNSGDDFSLEFIDIPGDYLTSNSIEVFIGVVKALTMCEDRIFNVYTWKSRDQKKEELIVKFSEVDTSSTTQKQEEILSDSTLPNIDITIGKPKTNTSAASGKSKYNPEREILPTTVVEENLRTKGYSSDETHRKISGKKLLEDFYQYQPDTVINAIVDAWDVLNIHIELENETSNKDKEQGISESDSPKARFSNVYKTQFYFLYFCLSATDVVLCDKMAVPNKDDLTREAQDEFSQMNTALRTFKSLLPSIGIKAEKNWYMTFKGVDSIIKQLSFQQFYNKTKDLDEDATYSLFLMLLGEYLKHISKSQNQTVEEDGFFDEDSEHTENVPPYMNDVDLFLEMLTGSNNDEIMKDFMYKYVKRLAHPESNHFFIKQPTEYYVPKGEDLFNYIKDRMTLFQRLVGECSDKDVFPYLHLPPHTFFSATPIDRDFNIYEHDNSDKRKFKGCVNQPERRLCFGTKQLLKDLLLQNGLALPENAHNYGALLAYIFGGR